MYGTLQFYITRQKKLNKYIVLLNFKIYPYNLVVMRYLIK